MMGCNILAEIKIMTSQVYAKICLSPAYEPKYYKRQRSELTHYYR